MAKDGGNRFDDLLRRLGFESEERPNMVLWQFPSSAPHPIEGKKAERPLLFDDCVLISKKNGLDFEKLTYRFDEAVMIKRLLDSARKYFGSRIHCEVRPIGDRIYQCVFEFVEPGSRDRAKGYGKTAGKSPHGCGGFQFQVQAEGQNIKLFFENYFGIGYIPRTIASAPVRWVRDALGIKKICDGHDLKDDLSSIFEMTIPMEDPLVSTLAATRGLAKHAAEIRRALQLRHHVGTLTWKKSGKIWELAYTSDHSMLDLAAFNAPVPMAALESRERANQYREIDVLIISEKWSKATQWLADKTDRNHEALFLARRLALLGLIGRRDLDVSIMQTAMEAEPNNLLFLSFLVAESINRESQASLLANLSVLGQGLAEAIPELESWRAFDMVLPEALGDAWSSEDKRRAEVCYLRVLQKRGDQPRILRKLVELARNAGSIDREVGYLERLVAVERRRVVLAQLYLRLAEIRSTSPNHRAEGVEYAMKAIANDRTQHEAARLAADLLVQDQRYREAINLLDGVIKQNPDLTSAARARLEAFIGNVWYHQLQRPDLAESRFEKALELDPQNIDALQTLENIYRQLAHRDGLVTLLESQFDVYERDENIARLREVFDELISIYRGPMNRPDLAYQLYRRAIGRLPVSVDELDRVLTWPTDAVDWGDLYGRLYDQIERVEAGENKAKLLTRLADMCRTKLSNHDLAERHALEALQNGWLDDTGFQYLKERFGQRRAYEQLIRVLELKAAMVQGVERRNLLIELLSVPQGLDDVKRDHLAVAAYLLDNEQVKIIANRFQFYQEQDDLEGLQRLSSAIQSAELPSERKVEWLKAAIHVLEASGQDRRFDLIDEYLSQLWEIDPEQTDIIAEIVVMFRNANRLEFLGNYIIRMLRSGQVPPLEEKLVQQLLSGRDHEMALYHQYMSFRAPSAQDQAGHARMAAVLFAGNPETSSHTEQMLARVAMLVPCAEQDLNQLKDLVKVSERWTLYTDALEQQLSFEEEVGRRARILSELGFTYSRHVKDPAQARKYLRSAMADVADPSAIRAELVELARAVEDRDEELELASASLRDPAIIRDVEQVRNVVHRIIELDGDTEEVRSLVEALVEKASSEGDLELAGRLARVLMEAGIGSFDLFRTVFQSAALGGEDDLARDTWWRALSQLSSRTKTKRFLEESQKFLRRNHRPNLYVVCLQAAIDHGVGERIGDRLMREVELAYARALFDNDERRREALPLLEEMYQRDAEENRVWMPLYFLLSEFGSDDRRREVLEALVPNLERDQKPLKEWPITLESLQAELAQLRGGSPVAHIQPQAQPQQSPDDLAMSLPMVGGEPDGFGEIEMHGVKFDGQEPRGAQARTQHAAGDDRFEPGLTIDGGMDGMGHGFGGQGDAAQDSEYSAVLDLNSLDYEAEASDPQLSGEPNVPVAEEAVAPGAKEPSPAAEPQARSEQPSPAFEDDEVSAVLDLAELQQSFDDAAADISRKDIAPEPPPPSDQPDPESNPKQFAESHASRVIEFDSLSNSSVSSVPNSSVELFAVMSDAGQRPAAPASHPEIALGSDHDAPTSLIPTPIDQRPGVDDELTQPSLPDAEAQSAQNSMSGVDHRSEGSVSVTGTNNGGQAVDWRRLAAGRKFVPELTQRLANQAFASELEKHVAIQTYAVLSGAFDALDNWHWRVWRHPEEVGYSLSGKDRFPRGMSDAVMHSDLKRLVIAMVPVFAKVYRHKFSLGYIARKMQTQQSQLEKMRRPVGWNEGLLAEVGFGHYAEKIARRRYKAFHLPGLGRRVFYEGSSRAIYFDAGHYRQAPPSHLFHRVLGMLWSVPMKFFVPLNLHPSRDVMPVLVEMHEHLSAQGITKIKSAIGKKSNVAKILSQMDSREIKYLHEKVGMPQKEAIGALWMAMRSHIFRMLIAETLDIVGSFESLLDKDLLAPGSLDPGEVFHRSPYSAGLIEFILRLKL